MIFYINESKPLALPWGRTSGLDSDVRVSEILGGLRKRLATSPRPSYYIRDVASMVLGLVFGSLICLVGPRACCDKAAQAQRPDLGSLLPRPFVFRDRLASLRLSFDCFLSFSTVFQAFLQLPDLFRLPGHVDPLVPLASTASGVSNDSIDNMFDEGDDVGQEHFAKRDDDAPTETIAKDASEVVVEKTKKFKRKRKAVGDASGFALPPKKLREDYRTATPSIERKSLAAIRGLIPEGSSIPSGVTEPFVVASLTPMPDCRNDGPTYFVFGLNLRTCPPNVRYVVSSDDSHHSSSCSEVNSFARSPIADVPIMTVAITTTIATDVSVVLVSKGRVKSRNLENFGDYVFAGKANANVASSSKLNEHATLSDSFYASQDLDSETLHRIYVPKWKVTNDFVLDDPYVCRDLTDCLAPPTLFSQLRAMDLGQHGKYAAKGSELKGLKEKNLALEEEKNVLSEKVTTLESVIAAKETELASLSAQVAKLTSDLSGFQVLRDELGSKRSSLESAFELFKGRMEAMQDEQEKALGEAISSMINTGMQDGLKAWIDHGKARRDLSVIKAHDPSAKAKYVDAVNALRTMDFSLLSVLKSKKDACMAALMDSLHLEGPLAEIPGAEELQPSLEQLILPIHKAEEDVVLGETSLSFSLQVVHSLIGEASTSAIPATAEPINTLSTTFASFGVVPPLSVSDYQVSNAEQHDEDPPAVTFEEEELDTTPE
ncbi:hypothetical protein Tco_0511380 [Tanacetum coccineum]